MEASSQSTTSTVPNGEAQLDRPGRGPGARAILKVVWIAIASALALYLVYLLRKPLGWMFIAGFVAIAASGPVGYLAKRMKRGLAIAIVYLAILLFPVALLSLLVPPIVTQVNHLIDDAPKYADDLTYEEMSRITGAGESALKMRVQRAFARLRAMLQEVPSV